MAAREWDTIYDQVEEESKPLWIDSPHWVAGVTWKQQSLPLADRSKRRMGRGQWQPQRLRTQRASKRY